MLHWQSETTFKKQVTGLKGTALIAIVTLAQNLWGYLLHQTSLSSSWKGFRPRHWGLDALLPTNSTQRRYHFHRCKLTPCKVFLHMMSLLRSNIRESKWCRDITKPMCVTMTVGSCVMMHKSSLWIVRVTNQQEMPIWFFWSLPRDGHQNQIINTGVLLWSASLIWHKWPARCDVLLGSRGTADGPV